MMDTLLADLRYALRTLRRSPGFTAVAVLTLALGIGANTAIFSVVNAVLLRPLPFHDPDRLVLLWERSPQLEFMTVAYPDFVDWREQSRAFEDIAVFNRYRTLNLTGVAEPERLATAVVTASLFPVLGAQAAVGRTFLPNEDHPGAPRTIVLSYGLWQRRFGSDPSLVGRALTLDGQSYTVVGVMPRGFQYPRGVEVWAPLGLFLDAGMRNRANHPGLVGLARLKPGVSLDQARVELSGIARRLGQQYPTNAAIGASMTPLVDVVVGGGVRRTLLVLLGAVGFVLLIACANVVNLLLARGAVRSGEIAIRAALGAGRVRVLRQLVTESLVLSLTGGAGGLLIAAWGVELLRAFAPDSLPRVAEIRIDGWVLGFTLVLSMIAGVVFGAAPLVQSARADLAGTLKAGGRGTTAAPSRHRLRSGLVAAEVALSLVLLTGAGLLLKSFVRLQQVDPGFDSKGVITFQVALPPAKYPTGPATAGFFRQALERAEAVPGVTAAAWVDPLPFSTGGWQAGVTLEGVPEPVPGDNPLLNASVVSPDFFRAMGVPITAGRAFSAHDDERAPRVAIVNRALVRRYWPGQNAVGKRVKFGPASSASPWMEIVGVSGDIRRTGLDAEAQAELYFPYARQPLRALTLVARTVGDPADYIRPLRGAVLALDPDQPVYNVRTMEQLLADSLVARRFSMTVLAVFAVVALLLALIGIYGVLAQFVAQRSNEMGIRVALGARAPDVVRLVIHQGMRPVAWGLAGGLVGALGLTRVLATLLFDVKPSDPATYAGVVALLAGAALLACYLPARRATKVDPVIALRYE